MPSPTEDTDPQAAVLCTIEPSFPQLIGACMQFLSLQDSVSPPAYYLRIVERAEGPFRTIKALAQSAGFTVRPVVPQFANRYLNKWTNLEELGEGNTAFWVLDWDIVFRRSCQFPSPPEGKTFARGNPPNLYGELALIGNEAVSGLWKGQDLLSSVNGGVVAGTLDTLRKVAGRTIELSLFAQARSPESAHWKLEQMAFSLAAGESGLELLPDEWNVTPGSPVNDESVISWHYNDGFECTRALKRQLGDPHAVEALLKELALTWPRQAERLNWLYPRALEHLGLTELLQAPKPRRSVKRSLFEKRVLICTCTSGLGNRLMMLAGCRRIAERTGRELWLYWPENAETGCPFGRLFENKFQFFTSAQLEYLLGSSRVVSLYNTWHSTGPHFNEIAADGDPTAEILLVKGWYFPKFVNESYSAEFFENVLPFLWDLQPTAELLKRVNEVELPCAVVGVHIRRVQMIEEFKRSDDAHFERIMRALIEKFPSISFFLATDDEITEAKFRALFGDRVIVQQKNRPARATPEGIEEALIDLLLLGHTAAVLGNHWSSFSSVASALGRKALIIADDKSANLELDLTIRRFADALHHVATPCEGVADFPNGAKG